MAALDCWFAFQFHGSKSATIDGAAGTMAASV